MTPTSAPQFVGGGRVAFEEREVPEPGVGQLLVQVRANALCGSERRQFEEGSEVVPGHEVAAEVAGAGPETSTPLGTHGVVFLMQFCGWCRGCVGGFTNQCLAKRGDIGFTRDGGYGPYVVVDERTFFPVPDDLAPADATLLLDVMGTSGHALRRIGQVRSDVESLLVTGAGPIGLGVLVMAKLLLGDELPVYVSDVVPYRLELAAALGGIALHAEEADRTFADESWAPLDAAVDSTGREAGRSTALRALGSRGVLVCVGHGQGLSLDVSADVIAPERSVLGSEYFRYDELDANLALLRAHRERLAPIVTHRYPVDALEEAFQTFLSGATGKVVVEQGSW